MADVVVVGAGPAGWAVARACAEEGLETALLAPRPAAAWQATYGLWTDQVGDLPVRPATAVLAGDRRLDRGYAVLDNDSALAAFRSAGVREVTGTAVSVTPGVAVELRSGERIAARVVVDATGARRVLSGGPPPGPRVEQTAYGVVLPETLAAPLCAPGEAVFMRWDTDADPPTFLYAVPLPGGRTLLEQTSLARRPGLPVDELRGRLEHRLAAAGVPTDRVLGTEYVRFAVDLPRFRPRPGVVAFGVAAGLMHPATGYSVGDSLTTAPTVAAALAAELPWGGAAAARAAHAALWPPAARTVLALRRWGLRTLLALPPARVPGFFDAFFALPADAQHAYLSGRADIRGTAAAMSAMFRAAPWDLRARLATGWARGVPAPG